MTSKEKSDIIKSAKAIVADAIRRKLAHPPRPETLATTRDFYPKSYKPRKTK